MWAVTEGSAPAAYSELLTDLMHPNSSCSIAFGTHSVLIRVAEVEISPAPEAGTTSQVHLHPQSNSSCGRQIYSCSQHHLVLAAHTDTEKRWECWPGHFTFDQPLLYLFLPTSTFLLHSPFLLHNSPSVCTVLLASQASGNPALHPCQLQSPSLLQFLGRPSVSVLVRFASCLCLHYGYLCLCIFCPCLLPFLCHLLCLGAKSGYSPEIKVPMSQYPFQWAQRMTFGNFVCFIICWSHLGLCMFFFMSSSITYFPFCTEKVLSKIP